MLNSATSTAYKSMQPLKTWTCCMCHFNNLNFPAWPEAGKATFPLSGCCLTHCCSLHPTLAFEFSKAQAQDREVALNNCHFQNIPWVLRIQPNPKTLHWVGNCSGRAQKLKDQVVTEKSLTNFPLGYDNCWSGWQLFLAVSTQRRDTLFQEH